MYRIIIGNVTLLARDRQLAAAHNKQLWVRSCRKVPVARRNVPIISIYMSLLCCGNLKFRPWAHLNATFLHTKITIKPIMYSFPWLLTSPCHVTISIRVYTGQPQVRVLLFFPFHKRTLSHKSGDFYLPMSIEDKHKSLFHSMCR